MLINVSTLLQEPLGSSRDYRATDELATVPEADFERRVSGRVRLIRSQRGVLVSAALNYEVELECARCARTFRAPITVTFDEEYVLAEEGARPDADEPPLDPDDFRIDEHRHLDLSEAIRQYELAALPLLPLCRPDCRGLCPTCGADLNEAPCACRAAETDERWGALSALADQLRAREDDHGASEA